MGVLASFATRDLSPFARWCCSVSKYMCKPFGSADSLPHAFYSTKVLMKHSSQGGHGGAMRGLIYFSVCALTFFLFLFSGDVPVGVLAPVAPLNLGAAGEISAPASGFEMAATASGSW